MLNWGYQRLHEKSRSVPSRNAHAESLIGRILFWKEPHRQQVECCKVGPDVARQLHCDLDAERVAVGMYNEAIHLADEVSDAATRKMLEEILKDEDRHVDWLEEQLDQIAQLGLPCTCPRRSHSRCSLREPKRTVRGANSDYRLFRCTDSIASPAWTNYPPH